MKNRVIRVHVRARTLHGSETRNLFPAMLRGLGVTAETVLNARRIGSKSPAVYRVRGFGCAVELHMGGGQLKRAK